MYMNIPSDTKRLLTDGNYLDQAFFLSSLGVEHFVHFFMKVQVALKGLNVNVTGDNNTNL